MNSNNKQDWEQEVETTTEVSTDSASTSSSASPKAASHGSAARQQSEDSLLKRIQRFWLEAMVEWKKITFPDSTPPWKLKPGQWANTNKGELYKLTLGVFIVSGVVAIIVAFMDIVVGLAYKGLYTIFSK